MFGNLFGRKIVCPYCFKETDEKNLEYMCMSKRGGCEIAESNKPIPNAKVKNGLVVCPKCGHTTNIFRCPNCNKTLPPELLRSKTRIISVVGCKSSGKSYYIGTLIRMIMEKALLTDYNQISTSWVDNKVDKVIYETRYKKNFDRKEKLAETNVINDILIDNPPILVVLERTENRTNVSDIFSFFDAAGENYDDAEMVESLAPYFKNSDAVILILDPRQIEDYRSIIDANYPEDILGKQQITPFQEVLEPTINLIRKEKRLNDNKKIDIPLCIAFSKWDLMINSPDLVPQDFLISKSTAFGGRYDESRVNTASQELRSLLNSIPSGKNLIAIAERHFETVNYFAFSSWGTPPSKEVPVPYPVPYRVEDPFLWVLRKDKII